MATPSPRRALTRRAEPDRKQPAPGAAPAVDATRRHAQICEAAYFRAQRRGFAPGGELDDWLLAETEVDRALLRDASAAFPARESGT